VLSGNIFISYRRDDTAGYAGRIFDRLSARFPNRVVMDIASFSIGEDFVAAIERQIAGCRVFLVLIGKDWATMTDEEGRRRLDQAEDFVRMEVAAALRKEVVVIPVLVRGARMPRAATLPGDIAAIVRHNALEITGEDFNYDIERLISRINEIFSPPPPPPPSLPPEPEPVPEPVPIPPWYLRFGRAGLAIGGVILGLLVLVTGIGVLVKSYRANSNARNDGSTQNTDLSNSAPTRSPTPKPGAVDPPADTIRFANSPANLTGDLAQGYVDFSFYYPKTWQMDPTAGVPGAKNFVKVERSLPGERTQESLAVGPYPFDPDVHKVVESLSPKIARGVPGFRKVSERYVKLGSYPGYEFRFEGHSGDIKIWGRTILLPPLEGQANGATLLLLTTSLAPELQGLTDVGVKGELPVILNTFRLGRLQNE
jgi:hypothetical protein